MWGRLQRIYHLRDDMSTLKMLYSNNINCGLVEQFNRSATEFNAIKFWWQRSVKCIEIVSNEIQ